MAHYCGVWDWAELYLARHDLTPRIQAAFSTLAWMELADAGGCEVGMTLWNVRSMNRTHHMLPSSAERLAPQDWVWEMMHGQYRHTLSIESQASIALSGQACQYERPIKVKVTVLRVGQCTTCIQ